MVFLGIPVDSHTVFLGVFSHVFPRYSYGFLGIRMAIPMAAPVAIPVHIPWASCPWVKGLIRPLRAL